MFLQWFVVNAGDKTIHNSYSIHSILGLDAMNANERVQCTGMVWNNNSVIWKHALYLLAYFSPGPDPSKYGAINIYTQIFVIVVHRDMKWIEKK